MRAVAGIVARAVVRFRTVASVCAAVCTTDAAAQGAAQGTAHEAARGTAHDAARANAHDGANGTAYGAAPAASRDAAPDAWRWDIPSWLPPPPVPADNPMSAAKVALGRHLFHDGRLSTDATVACSTCHDQAMAFTDGRDVSTGVGEARGHRNAQGLANVGYSPSVTWANPNLRTLEFHALVPLFGDAPLEMGNAGSEAALFERLLADERYAELFAEAFPERTDADGAPEVSLYTITRALGAFQRTLISADSPYDRYKHGGETDAVSDSAKLGESLFFSERLECYHCHQGFNFTDTLRTSRHRFDEVAFHNTGLYDVDGRGSYPASDQGLADVTANPADRGRFRTPTLRNVELTAPYFHDGSAATLDDVIDHYAAAGRRIDSGPGAGNGATSPLKNALVVGFELSDAERKGLLDFLKSLTDEGFTTNPAYSDPWPEGHPARATRRDAAPATVAPATTRRAIAAPVLLLLALLLASALVMRARERRAHSNLHP